uniref:(California timema) hypothetical protein n=1 Tax=Timema californicum TaxID=61474 RepID=A0A7R9JGQ2_TIMCA|nr:unnamed protein product [Timema californicum]
MGSMQIGILGAGVVGLNTALELQRQFPTARLTIIADKFNEETTSDGAAGIFRPSTSFSGPTENITNEWIQRSYDYYNELYLSEQASLAGVNRVSGHIVSSISPEIVRPSGVPWDLANLVEVESQQKPGQVQTGDWSGPKPTGSEQLAASWVG